MNVSKQSVLRQGRQSTQHAAKGDIATGLKTGRGTVEKADGGQNTFVGPGASGAHFGRGIKGGPRGFVGGVRWLCNQSFFGCRFPWLGGTRPDQSSVLNRLSERVELEAQFLGDFQWAQTSSQQPLCLGRDLRRDHRGPAWCARRVERSHASGAVSIDTANDAVFRDSEGPHDVRLATSTLADQLRGKHLETAVVTFGVVEYRLDAAEVDPLAILAYHADRIADPRGTVGDERQ